MEMYSTLYLGGNFGRIVGNFGLFIIDFGGQIFSRPIFGLCRLVDHSFFRLIIGAGPCFPLAPWWLP
jgi:hypothetical protein